MIGYGFGLVLAFAIGTIFGVGKSRRYSLEAEALLDSHAIELEAGKEHLAATELNLTKAEDLEKRNELLLADVKKLLEQYQQKSKRSTAAAQPPPLPPAESKSSDTP